MEGSQATIIIAKLLMSIIKLLDRMRRDYLEYRFRKRQLGLKSNSIFRSDKRELKFAKNFKKSLSMREQKLTQQIKESQYELDSYKLNMQLKLENQNAEIKKIQQAYDTAKESYDMNRRNPNYSESQLETDKKNLVKFQENINTKLDEKRNFETEVNKNLLKKDKNYKDLLEQHNKLLDDIKICDRAIDGLSSKFEQHITESLRNNFNEVIDRNIKDNEIKEPGHSKNDDFMKKYLEQQKRKSLARERQKEITRHQTMER